LGLETVGERPSDAYLIQGFINGYGGRVAVAEDDSSLVGFTVEFPVRQNVTDGGTTPEHSSIE
jgi:hypothetical protein